VKPYNYGKTCSAIWLKQRRIYIEMMPEREEEEDSCGGLVRANNLDTTLSSS
jgi:hypothetical protein